ncbi:MAG: glycosyltransferase family 4 protein [Clostridia bacterium]|nr:glycosyltransferase family 4 protein [Clostridia bacterium]
MREPGAKTIMVVAADGDTLTNFRGPLIRYLTAQGHRVICVSIEPPEEMAAAAAALGAEYRQVAGSRVGIGIGDGLRMIRGYRRLFAAERPDLCFFYMSKPTAFGSIAAVLSRTKHFNVLVNGLENAFYRTGPKDFIVRCVMSAAYRFAARHADNMFFQNHDDLAYFRSHHLLPRENATVVGGSGVDMQYFTRQPLPDAPVFLMVARLLWSKGIREFLEAARLLRQAHPAAEILLVGGLDHNDEALTQAELDAAIRESGIEYCGYAADVRPYLKRCSVFVLPSYHEGLPRSVIEAMATGRAILTTDVPGCRETVVDGKNGYLVPVRESGPLVEKMIALAADGAKRAAMAEASYQMCLEKFEVGRVNRTMVQAMLDSSEK